MVYHPDLGYIENGIDFTDIDLYKEASLAFGKASLLPTFSYQSKIFSDLEDEKLWTRSWVAVGSTQQIPNAGDLLPFTVGRHGLHVQRQEDGNLIARFNKAQHGGCRAIPLQCQTGKKTKCSFTSCGYSRDRNAIKAEEIGENTPTMHQYLGLIPERLLSVKVQTLGPFIFVNLNPDSESLNEEFSSLPNSINFDSHTNYHLQADQWFECQSNWKLIGRAFYPLENSENYHDAHGLNEDTSYFQASDISISEFSNKNDATKATIQWLFPNLIIIETSAYLVSVILQPNSMQESLLRTCVFNKTAQKEENESIPKDIDNYIQAVKERAKTFQEITEKVDGSESPVWSNRIVPIENNIAGYVFQQYVMKSITTVHQYYWNAPLYTINPIA